MQTSRRSFLGMLAAALPSSSIPVPVAAIKDYYIIEWPVVSRQWEYGCSSVQLLSYDIQIDNARMKFIENFYNNVRSSNAS